MALRSIRERTPIDTNMGSSCPQHCLESLSRPAGQREMPWTRKGGHPDPKRGSPVLNNSFLRAILSANIRSYRAPNSKNGQQLRERYPEKPGRLQNSPFATSLAQELPVN